MFNKQNKREITSIDMWYIICNNLVTWSHLITLVTVEVSNIDNDALDGYYGPV